MAFTGAWRQRAMSPDPYEKLHTAGADHVRDSTDPNPTWELSGDLTTGVPEFIEDSDHPDISWLVIDTAGVTYDMTDYQSHEAPDSPRVAPDEGASRQRGYGPPVLQSHDTRYLAPRFEGLATAPVNNIANQRGLNADPVNNPEGFRFGWVEQYWVDRKFYEGERVHDRRLLTPNTAYVDTGQPSQPVPFGNPFASLARIITSANQRPMIRRQPPTIDETIVTDGSDDTYANDYPEWVTG